MLREHVSVNEEITFFVRHGDLIGRCAIWAGLAFVLGLVAVGVKRRLG